MELTVYGLLGYSGFLKLPIESLDLEELELGEEFIYEGKVYQIRSMIEHGENITLNVTMSMDSARV